MWAWLDSGVRGLGQVVFLPGRWSGLVILAGLGWADVRLALGGLLGALIGSAVARGLRRDPAEIAAGLWSFNGALVGLAGLALERGFWGLAFAGLTVPAGMLLGQLKRLGLPPYTLPFIVVTWLMGWVVPPLGPLGPVAMQRIAAEVEVLKGLAQIFLVDDLQTGWAVGLALAIYRPWWAVVAWSASLTGLMAGFVGFAEPPRGVLGFNAVLTALALAPTRAIGLPWVVLCAVASTRLALDMSLPGGLPALTLPFVLTAWVLGLVREAWVLSQAR